MPDQNAARRRLGYRLQIIWTLAVAIMLGGIVVPAHFAKKLSPLEGACRLQPITTGMLKAPARWRIRPGEKYRRHPLVSYTINKHGEVSEVKILSSSGVRDIDAWVLRSVRRWRYEPLPKCETQTAEMVVTVDFDKAEEPQHGAKQWR